jgi:hypothetical protein
LFGGANIILLLNELIVRVYSTVLVFLVLDFDFELLELLALPSLAEPSTWGPVLQ